MRTLILSILLLSASYTAHAQSEWENPSAEKAEVSHTEKPQEKMKSTAFTDDRYIKEGAVPEENGKVVFQKNFSYPAMSAKSIYDAAYKNFEDLLEEQNQIQSNIVLVNKKEHIIAARFSEWMEFSRSFFALDRTKFNFTIVAYCTDGQLDVRIERISYNYEEGRTTGFKASAEELISDKNALNKKRTKLTRGSAKFRIKTIDRIEEIFNGINSAINNQQ